MKKMLVGICMILVMAAAASCGAQPSAGSSSQAQSASRLETRIAELEQENERLQQQLEAYQQAEGSGSQSRREDPGQDALLQDLPNQTVLIPIEAELGGTFRFYPDETKILNGKYVYAYAEDGHVAVDMILGYVINADDSISWSLAAYDAGDGWVPGN